MKYKSNINFIIDALMFIVMMAMGGIGLLMKFILVPGSERWEIYGSNVDLFVWGWDRHQWGSVHLILGYILFGLLILHIILHWKQIKAMFIHLIQQRTARLVLTLLFVFVSLILLLFFLLIPKEVVPISRGEGHQAEHRLEIGRPQKQESQDRQKTEAPRIVTESEAEHVEEEHDRDRSIEVNGSMTLKDVANKYGVPSDSLKKLLGITLNTSDNEKLGRLRRRYGFHMSDVERFIEKYHQK